MALVEIQVEQRVALVVVVVLVLLLEVQLVMQQAALVVSVIHQLQ